MNLKRQNQSSKTLTPSSLNDIFLISDSGEHKKCESFNQNFLVIDYDGLEAMGRIKNTTDTYRQMA